MYIISYDIASKSLAVSIIYFNDGWKKEFNEIKNNYHTELTKLIPPNISIKKCKCINTYVNKLEILMDTMIIPKFFDVVDLIPNKKLKETTTILRTTRLKAYLQYIDGVIESIVCEANKCKANKCNTNFKVLLEYQMGPNDKSRTIGSQVLYHYSNLNNEFVNSTVCKSNIEISTGHKMDIEIIGPSLKNKINLDIDKHYEFFMKKYSKSYDANKAHSKANFLYWVKSKNIEYMIKNIKKKNLDDIADSVTMTLAWLYIKSGLIKN